MSLNITDKNSNEKRLQVFARIGYIAKGVVYCLISLLALLTAIGKNDRKENKEEAFKMVYEQPFGQVILFIIGICLLGFVTLRFFQSVKDSDHKGSGWKAIFKRIGYGISALIYTGISILAIKLAVGSSGSGGMSHTYLAKGMALPGGTTVIAIIAALIFGQGAYQIYRGVSSKFMKKVKLYNSNFSKTFQTMGIVGFAARGLVLCLIGYFLFRAALHSNAKEAEGTEGAFHFVQNLFGNWVLGIMAGGLMAYGIFMFVRAKHERINFDL